MSKKIVDKNNMAEAIAAGITEIAAIVKRTLGPGGLPILIEREGQALDGSPLGPMITKDGVTVASFCSNPDPQIDLVIQAVKAICAKTNRVAGDGTTSAIVLGEAILREALKALKADETLNPQAVRESIEAAARSALEILLADVVRVDSADQIESVATISANGDVAIGQVIRQAFEEVGNEGVITVDEGHGAETTIEVVKGFQIKRGAEAQDRFFNSADRTKFESNQTNVILYDGHLQSFTEIIPALKASVRGGALPPTVIVANEFSPEVIQFLLIQKAEMAATICAVRSPHMSHVRTAMLDDMAVLLGATRFGNGNKALSAATPEDIGTCERIVSDKYSTTFYGGEGSEEDVLARVDQIKALKTQAESAYDAGVLADRIAALSQGVAKIGVGGLTELEVKERYHRIEDALNAARAAIEEGTVIGGGVALYRVAEVLRRDGSTVGASILANALKAPIHQILENVGESPKKILTTAFLRQVMNQEGVVYDARTKTLVHARAAGILDPFKVVRVALENAVSIAALLSTCGGGIINTREGR